jgi:hypothetical protein
MIRWTKYFIDGTSETASEEDIDRGLASWSRGRLQKMIASSIQDDFQIISIGSPVVGEFWQSTTAIAIFNSDSVESSSVECRIERCISQADLDANLAIFIEKLDRQPSAVLAPTICKDELLKDGFEFLVEVSGNLVGKWFVAELDGVKKLAKFYFSPVRI